MQEISIAGNSLTLPKYFVKGIFFSSRNDVFPGASPLREKLPSINPQLASAKGSFPITGSAPAMKKVAKTTKTKPLPKNSPSIFIVHPPENPNATLIKHPTTDRRPAIVIPFPPQSPWLVSPKLPTNPSRCGGKLPNGVGWYDMCGSVTEFCWDWRAEYPHGSLTDYRGSGIGENRVSRGGKHESQAQTPAQSYVAEPQASTRC